MAVALVGAEAARGQDTQSKLVPSGWTVQRDEGRKDVIRYVSPDRTAVLTLRDEPTGGRSVADAYAKLARRDGDDVTYARKARSWFVLSGYRGDEIFYTRVDLACGKRRWHVLELTYPRAAKADMDAEVDRVSRSLRRYQNICPSEGRGAG
jgi:hypothetical protein